MYPQVFGKYVLEGELARGGMARVLLATLRGAGGFEKKLVVKQIRDELAFDQEFIRRFVQEAKTTVALSHPNIVPVYELGVEQGTYFLAMELVAGVSVAELLASGRASGVPRRPLSPEEGAYVGVEVCRALDYAHRRMNVVHRDVTPRNVMIDEEGQVKVIDFGIAAPASVKGHEVFGSPGHMPPEQMEGKELGPPTDVFAVATLLLEAWSGAAPFRRATPEESAAAMRAPPPKPSAIDIRLLPLDDIVARALSLDPRERPQDIEELGKALRRFLSGVDLGDLAHALGDRVRDVREAMRAASRRSAPASTRRASMPSAPEAGTKTFAAREEVEAWTAPGPDTRAMKDATPQAPLQVAAPLPEPRTRALPPSVPPPPRLPDEIETLATRPLEASTRRHRRSRLALLATIAASAVVLVALAVPIVRDAAHVAAPVITASAPPPIAMPSAAATSSGAAAPQVTLPAPSASPAASPPAPPSASAPVPAVPAGARVSLFGDPGTRVAVDGSARGACPIRDVILEPGAHEVRFTFDPTGESTGERIVVKPGDRVTLRADFAGVAPLIRVQR